MNGLPYQNVGLYLAPGTSAWSRGIARWVFRQRISRFSTLGIGGKTNPAISYRRLAQHYTTWVLLCIRLKTSPSNCLSVTAGSGIGRIDPRHGRPRDIRPCPRATQLGGLALRRQGEATGKRHMNDERNNPGRSGVPYIG